MGGLNKVIHAIYLANCMAQRKNSGNIAIIIIIIIIQGWYLEKHIWRLGKMMPWTQDGINSRDSQQQ